KAFNRNPNFYDRTEELNQYKLLHLSTHCHLKTTDNMLLFGTKKNQSNQISGFGGFPNVEKESIKIEGESYLDIYKTLCNRLTAEIGTLVSEIESIQAVGITYVDNPCLRGVDLDYLIELNETSDNARKQFKASAQFKRCLFTVEFKPTKIAAFIEGIYQQKREMSPYALGCIVAEIGGMYGMKEANIIPNNA
ncbi:MAG: hypothetical protein AAB257_01575, partial [Nitrospinota bacterium]